jgi:predicted alpha/beta-hydrolase family hydrolase
MAIPYFVDTINGTKVRSFFPAGNAHHSVLYFFHGGGGSSKSFSESTAGNAVAVDAIQRGYGVVFLESDNRWTGKWKPTADPMTCPDRVNIGVARTRFEIRGSLGSRKELALGMSNGGGFAPYASHSFNWEAVAVYCATGYPELLSDPDYDTPTIFFPGEIDTTVPLAEVQASHAILLGRSIPTDLSIIMGGDHGFVSTKCPEMFGFFANY